MKPEIRSGRQGRMRVAAGILVMAAVLDAATSSPAQAQSSRGSVNQIGSSQPVGMLQLSGRSAALPSPQLTSDVKSASSGPQLAGERGSGLTAQQLTRGERSAQPSEPLSRPEESRTTAVERVAGNDRCDPASRHPRAAQCAQVIETRAAEFTRLDPTPLSPEQRIIMEQQIRERSGSWRGTTRRLAANGDDAQSMGAQGVASVVLSAPPAEPLRDKPNDDAAASEQLQAIVSGILNQPPPQ